MVQIQLSNIKLVNRGVVMLKDELHINQELASEPLEEYQSVKNNFALFLKFI